MNLSSIKLILSIISINCFQIYVFSQDYTRYYELIDSAAYFKSIGDRTQANEYYLHGLSSFRGFPDDYISAITNNYFDNEKLDFDLVKKAFSDGVSYNDLKISLLANKVVFSKKELKKIFKENKLKKNKNISPIHYALIGDQLSRIRKNGNISKADKRTGEKIKKWIVKKPYLFDRFETGSIGSELMYVLMIHSGWDNLESVQDTIYNLIKNGKIHRDVFADIIERGALYKGYTFFVDSINHKIFCKKDINVFACDTYYSNICFNYGRIYDGERNLMLLPPILPALSESDVNSLRNHIFLSNLNLLYSHPKYLKVSAEEYCKFKLKKIQ